MEEQYIMQFYQLGLSTHEHMIVLKEADRRTLYPCYSLSRHELIWGPLSLMPMPPHGNKVFIGIHHLNRVKARIFSIQTTHQLMIFYMVSMYVCSCLQMQWLQPHCIRRRLYPLCHWPYWILCAILFLLLTHLKVNAFYLSLSMMHLFIST